MKRTKNLEKQLKFHCFRCQTIYQLIEVHSQAKPNCPDNCLKQWKELCHEYYQEKILAYLKQQEEAQEKDLEERGNFDWLKKATK